MKQYSFYSSLLFHFLMKLAKQELPCTSVHNVKLQDNNRLALKTIRSHDVKKAALAYPDPASLFGNSDGQIPGVAMQLLWRVQQSVIKIEFLCYHQITHKQSLEAETAFHYFLIRKTHKRQLENLVYDKQSKFCISLTAHQQLYSQNIEIWMYFNLFGISTAKVKTDKLGQKQKKNRYCLWDTHTHTHTHK